MFKKNSSTSVLISEDLDKPGALNSVLYLNLILHFKLLRKDEIIPLFKYNIPKHFYKNQISIYI